MPRIAATVARSKEQHPERYCPERRCLWRTGGGYCPRHAYLHPAPSDFKCSYPACKCATICYVTGRTIHALPREDS